MNNKKSQKTEKNDFFFTPVLPYVAENAVFVLCRTPESEQCHVRFSFSDIVSIQTDGNCRCNILTTDGKQHTALVAMTEILVWLPESKFARTSWNEAVNISLVDMIIGNILYINGTHYILDRMFAETVLKAFHSVDRNDTESAVPSAYNDSVFLRIGNEYRRVRIDEIQWIESFHNYCDVYTASSPRPYCSDFSMNVWLKILPEDHFVRLHRSAIVNVNYVDAIQAGKVSIQGHSFEVPRTQRREIPKRFHLIQRKQTDKRLSKWLEKHTQ